MSIKRKIRNLIPDSWINFYHRVLAFGGAFFYRFPSRSIKVIGVTGTSGKSTTVELISQILSDNGSRVASFSSIRVRVGDEEKPNKLKMTMPGRGRLQKFLRKARDNNCRYAVIEVTSEGIRQHRHRFINFNTIVFTNLSPEHIERHGSYSNYKKTKGELFDYLSESCKKDKKIIANIDDKESPYFLKFNADQKIGFGISPFYKDFSGEKIIAKNVDLKVNGSTFKINNTKFELNLLAEFNTYNALAAISVAYLEGLEMDDIAASLININSMPGRMELIIKEPFTVVVDYAHTPKALKGVYKTLTSLSKKGHLIGVLGACGGGRDKWKRPVFGEIAAAFCDQIILTNEDPYNEDPLQIIKDIEEGLPENCSCYQIIKERERAIKKALQEAVAGDVVVITGKGSENLMCLSNGEKIPWDDREVVRDKLNELDIKTS